MKLEQSFEVAAPIDQVWAALNDLERVAPCLPGAAITDHDDDGTYHGTFQVKLGPTTASYRGTIKIESADESTHTATLKARGTDKRGQGGASATIVNSLTEHDGGDDGRGGHRLLDHRAAGALRARRHDGGHLQPHDARLRDLPVVAPGRRPGCAERRGDRQGRGAARGGRRRGPAGGRGHGSRRGGAHTPPPPRRRRLLRPSRWVGSVCSSPSCGSGSRAASGGVAVRADPAMEQRLSLVTLGVADVPAARAFYEALGWTCDTDPALDVAFFQLGGIALAVWDRKQLAEDSTVTDRGGFGGVTLAYNVRSPEEVDAALAEAEAAGATIGRPGAKTFWGGYSGVFVDPDGHPWEVAHNPHWTIEADGSVRI